MLKETERATGGLPYQSSTSNKREPVERIPTLADLGKICRRNKKYLILI
jgi:hypothetical protein